MTWSGNDGGFNMWRISQNKRKNVAKIAKFSYGGGEGHDNIKWLEKGQWLKFTQWRETCKGREQMGSGGYVENFRLCPISKATDEGL